MVNYGIEEEFRRLAVPTERNERIREVRMAHRAHAKAAKPKVQRAAVVRRAVERPEPRPFGWV